MTANDRSKAVANKLNLCYLLMAELVSDVSKDLHEDSEREDCERYKMPRVQSRKEQIRYIRAKLSELSKLLNEERTKR